MTLSSDWMPSLRDTRCFIPDSSRNRSWPRRCLRSRATIWDNSRCCSLLVCHTRRYSLQKVKRATTKRFGTNDKIGAALETFCSPGNGRFGKIPHEQSRSPTSGDRVAIKCPVLLLSTMLEMICNTTEALITHRYVERYTRAQQ
jgi:hypothetical protein